MAKAEDRSIDSASQKMLREAEAAGVETSWDRFDAQQPQCGFGQLGVCCRICNMGPCRVDPFGQGAQEGVCGADADTIVARNLVRMIAAGAAAHSDHGRDVAEAVIGVARHPESGYKIRDEKKLRRLAEECGIETEGKDVPELAEAVGERLLAEFGQQEGELLFPQRAPEKRKELWRELGVMPRGVDREIVQIMHQTHMGVDADYHNLLLQGIRAALGDGWGGSMIATDLQDALFGSPEPLRATTNLGVMKENRVNILLHGHEPALSDMLVEAARDPEVQKAAEEAGAEGVQLAGICCTGNEILMRHGIPSAGSFLHQELAVMTGAADAMIVDVQCWMPGLLRLAQCFHTKLISTSYKAKMKGVDHIQFEEARAYEVAKEIILAGVANFPNRDSARINIPEESMDLIAGFTADYVYTLLGGRFRPSYRPLNDAIIQGRIRGVAGVVGCENPKQKQGFSHVAMMKELIKNDVLVISTGCSALAAAREGLLQPEAGREQAGRGLAEVCEAVGMPPVLHCGSCVDNSRILIACCEVLKEGGLGEDISDLPVAGAAPEWMSEKAISIGFYVVGSGIYTVFSTPHPVMGAPEVSKYITDKMTEDVGACFGFEEDPIKAAHMMIEHMNEKRAALKLQPMMYESEAAAG